MNYSQEIEQIERVYNDMYLVPKKFNEIYEDLLTIAKKMQKEIAELKFRMEGLEK